MGDAQNTHSEEGNTPLDEDEMEGLIPSHISTRAELNAWEAENIRSAIEWASSLTIDILDVSVLIALHRRMFDQTWRWAGKYRTSEKSISPHPWPEVPRLVRDLIENTREQLPHTNDQLGLLDDLAVRFHHQLVVIHPWPNGNGRHARLATDLLLRRHGRTEFTWGRATHSGDGPAARRAYLLALREADAGAYDALKRFVRR